MKISVIIPVFNDQLRLSGLLEKLENITAGGHEIIIVDGGSEDFPASVGARKNIRLISAGRGRARQMNAGAQEATGDVLWFLQVLEPYAD